MSHKCKLVDPGGCGFLLQQGNKQVLQEATYCAQTSTPPNPRERLWVCSMFSSIWHTEAPFIFCRKFHFSNFVSHLAFSIFPPIVFSHLHLLSSIYGRKKISRNEKSRKWEISLYQHTKKIVIHGQKNLIGFLRKLIMKSDRYKMWWLRLNQQYWMK